MAAAFTAMSISGGILLLVIGLVVAVTITAVKRGTAAMEEESKRPRS